MTNIEKVLFDTHKRAALRANASTEVVKVSFACNGNNPIKSLCAGIMTIGGRHAPIRQTYQMIDDLKNGEYAIAELENYCGNYIPGFGSSFIKEDYDPLLKEINYELLTFNSEYIELMFSIKNYIYNAMGKNLYPNLAFYTAAVAHMNDVNINFCESLMIKARVEAWLEMMEEEAIGGR